MNALPPPSDVDYHDRTCKRPAAGSESAGTTPQFGCIYTLFSTAQCGALDGDASETARVIPQRDGSVGSVASAGGGRLYAQRRPRC